MFNADSLKAGIEACKKNIQTFEDAIQRERETIQDYYNKIEVIERKQREAKLAKQDIVIERVSDNDNQK